MLSRAKTQRMAVSGTATFDNSADYQAAIGGACVNLSVTGGGDFIASLTWLNLRYLRVVRGGENGASRARTGGHTRKKDDFTQQPWGPRAVAC